MSNWENIGVELQNGGRKSKADFFSMVDGINVLRILTEPYTRYCHWIPAAKTGVDCIGEDCPICKVNKEFRAAGKDQPYSNSKKFIMYVYNRNSGKIELWDFGKKMMAQLFTEMTDRKDDGKSPNPTTFDLRIRKTGDTVSIKSADEVLDASVLEQLATFKPIEDVSLKLEADVIMQLMEGKRLKEIFAEQNTADSDDVIIV